jgi:hypothetical protein
MEKLKLLVLLSLFTLISSKGCVLYQDSYISYENTYYNGTSSLLLKFFTYNRKGWSGVGFGPQNNHNSSNFFIVGQFPSPLVEFENLTSISTQTQVLSSGWVSKWNYWIDNTLEFDFILPLTFFQKQNFVFFIFNKNKGLTDNFLLDANEIGTRVISLLNDTSVDCFDQLAGIGKIEALHPASFSVVIFIYGVVGIICIILYLFKLRPIFSRKFAPILGTIAQMFVLFIYGVLNFATTNEFRNKYLCYFEGYLLYPAIESIYLVALLNFFRYLLIINLNQTKVKLFSEQDKKIRINIFLKIFKRLTSPVVVLLINALYIIFLMVVFTVVLAIFKFQCAPLQRTLFNFIHLGFTGLLAILIIIVQLYDFIINIPRLITCKMTLIHFFINKDPFFFRLEMSSSIVLIVFFISYSVSGISGITVFILNSLVYFWLWYITTLFSVVVTIISFIVTKLQNLIYKDKLEKNIIEGILADAELHKLFQEFAKNEWSLENLYIKLDLLKYKRLKDKSTRKSLAEKIYEKYLSGSEAVMEVNIESSARHKVRKSIDEDMIDEEIFKQVETVVDMNLFDTYHRFRHSRDYMVLMREKKIVDGMLEIRKSSIPL